MWDALFKCYWHLVTFKESPENTPYSPLLMILAAWSFFLLLVLQWYLADINQKFNLANAILAGLGLLCSYFVYTFLLLKIFCKANRALQTLTALLISHMIIHFFAFPLLFTTPLLATSGMSPAFVLFVSVSYISYTFALTVWQFLITLYIYKQALEFDYLSAVLAGFGLLACNILTVSFWQ